MSIQNNSWQYEEQDPQRYATNEQNRALGQGMDKERGAYDYEKEKQAIANDVVSANNLIAQNAQQWEVLNKAAQWQDFKNMYGAAAQGAEGDAQRAMAAQGGQMIRQQLQNMGADPSILEAGNKLDGKGFQIMLDGMRRNNLNQYLSMENPDIKANRLMHDFLKQGMTESQARKRTLAELGEYEATYNQLGKLAMGQYGAENDIVGRNAAMIAALNNDPRTLQIFASVLPTRADEMQHEWKTADREQVADIAARQSKNAFEYNRALTREKLNSAERINNANNAIKKYGIDVGRDVSLAKINADISMFREQLAALRNGTINSKSSGQSDSSPKLSNAAQAFLNQIDDYTSELLDNEASEALRVQTGDNLDDFQTKIKEAYHGNKISKEEYDQLQVMKDKLVNLRQRKWNYSDYMNKYQEEAQRTSVGGSNRFG